MFTCVGWQATLCDPIWQLGKCHGIRSINSYTVPLPFSPLLPTTCPKYLKVETYLVYLLPTDNNGKSSATIEYSAD